MALYPPIMASSQDAFLAQSNTLSIYFTLSSTTNIQDIRSTGHVQIKLVYQTNNKSASNKYPDGIIYKPGSRIEGHGNGIYSIPIDYTDLTAGWIANRYYKVQICFGKNSLWSGYPDSTTTFADWKANQILLNKNSELISEWSTVKVLKAINTPTIKITNQEGQSSDYQDDDSLVVESSIATELTTTPLFQGYFSCSGEPEDKYRFDLYYQGNLIESSGWLQHNNVGGIDTFRFTTLLNDFEIYNVKYQVITVNGYESSIVDYEFMVNENFLTQLEGIKLLVEDIRNQEEPYADENGILNIYLTSNSKLSGNYVLTRSSERSNFVIWETIKYFVFSNREFNKDLIYQDFTVESGIRYKYAFQQENRAGLRSQPTYESTTLANSPERVSNFQYSYLYNDGVQLKLQLDNKVSSFKHTVLASKQDTLGSKYPTINRNGDAYYAEFQISGLISLHIDEDQTFFKKERDGYYYRGEKVIDLDKYTDTSNGLDTFDQDLSNNNIFIERIFREKVEEFLNDGGYKLYKSPTEGNIIISLMNVSLTPNETLGRMIYSFSATAYEVLDNTIDNLDKYGLIDVGSFQEDITSGTNGNITGYTSLIGQISGLFGTRTNLVDKIKEDNEYDIGGGYQYHFEKLISIQIEAYPAIKFTDKINELEAKYIQAKTANDAALMSQLRTEINELKTLENAANKQVAYPLVTVIINGKPISLSANRIYQLKNSETITSIYLKHDIPVIVNYICLVSSEESESSTISAITTTSAWGQLAGVFTTTKKVLDNYQLNRPTNSFKVSDSYNYNLYQSLDITEIIKEEVRKQVERQYNTTFTYDAASGTWTDGRYYYLFQQFSAIELEADEGTVFLITNAEDDVQQEIIIGPTNKYRLENLNPLVSNITLKDPSFVIVNYRCLTMQMTMGV